MQTIQLDVDLQKTSSRIIFEKKIKQNAVKDLRSDQSTTLTTKNRWMNEICPKASIYYNITACSFFDDEVLLTCREGRQVSIPWLYNKLTKQCYPFLLVTNNTSQTSMFWLDDHTGVEYYPEVKRNYMTEAVEAHIYIGNDDSW